MTTTVSDQPITGKPASERLLSVDVLRGFDMFWIVGAGGLVMGLQKAAQGRAWIDFLATQLKHVEWEGFRFYDLIFPLFVFIAGVSLAFSLGKILASEGLAKTYWRLFRRAVVLFLLGVIYSGLFYRDGAEQHWPDIRVLGVLQRIALSYFFASLLFCHLRERGLIVAVVLLLAGYWAVMTFVAAPGQPHVSFEPSKNIANYIDARFLPGKLFYGSYDPEGILSTLPAIATCLLGVLSGIVLRKSTLTNLKKVGMLMGVGVLLTAAGYCWGYQFPIVKKIWTSSFVLVAGGYSMMLLGSFYLIIDVWKVRFWTAPFVWIGGNALAIYMSCNLIDFRNIARRLVGGNVSDLFGVYGPLLVSVVGFAIILWYARLLYKKQILLKV